MNQAAIRPSIDHSAEKTKMVHLGPADSPPWVTYCGAVTRKNLPDSVEIDCVVCVELARADGYDL